MSMARRDSQRSAAQSRAARFSLPLKVQAKQRERGGYEMGGTGPLQIESVAFASRAYLLSYCCCCCFSAAHLVFLSAFSPAATAGLATNRF